jgi:hypothetical protein
LITFGSGADPYSNETPASFNFSTAHRQVFLPLTYGGVFGFVNAIPNIYYGWHVGAVDHTANDVDGYMYFVDVGEYGDQVFNFSVNDLCIGMRYEFSAYLANVMKKEHAHPEPNIRFEVRTATAESQLIAELPTGNISGYDNMAWSRCSLSFIASSSSIVLLMVSDVKQAGGNDLAIDDIELRVDSNADCCFCALG